MASVTGNLTNLASGQVLLPGFITQRDDGLFVDLTRLASDTDFTRFVDHVIAASARFDGVDYAVFAKLVDVGDQPAVGAVVARLAKLGKKPEWRLAAGIAAFPDERKALYRGLTIDPSGMTAEYMFEPVFIEHVVDEPVYEQPAADAPAGSEPQVVGTAQRVVSEATSINFDEFVAAAWEKGLRFGIDAGLVRDAIRTGAGGRLVVAQGVPAKRGDDATLAEETRALHRDNTPKILADGRVDLRQFENRFPQIKRGTRLLKKIPRTLGENGRDVFGTVLEPEPSKDFDLTPLAGPGTRIENSGQGEFLVADGDGFLSIDAHSNQVSITTKIVSHEGISARTTGDLALCGDDYEEHGEVQERRTVKGLNMTFFANVFGNLVSQGGEIIVHANLAGGGAESDRGRVKIAGKASRARLVARGGEIEAAMAEGCLIVGGRVKVERAINCVICADELDIGAAEGCALAARQARLGVSLAHKDTENALSMLTPDFSAIDLHLGARRKHLAELAARRRELEKAALALAESKELKTFLLLLQSIQAGKLVLKPEQKQNWEQMKAHAAPGLRQLGSLREQSKAVEAEEAAVAAEIEAVFAERAGAAVGISCVIDEISGDTEVRTLPLAADEAPPDQLSQRDLELQLRSLSRRGTRLFSGASGSFAWQFVAADPA